MENKSVKAAGALMSITLVSTSGFKVMKQILVKKTSIRSVQTRQGIHGRRLELLCEEASGGAVVRSAESLAAAVQRGRGGRSMRLMQWPSRELSEEHSLY